MRVLAANRRTSISFRRRYSQPPQQVPAATKRRKEINTYGIYYKRILNSLFENENMSLSKEAISVLDSMMEDVFDRLVTQACHLMRYSRKKPKITLDERDLHFALQLAFPPELFIHAAGCAVTAVRRIKSCRPCTPIMDEPRDNENQRNPHRFNGSFESPSGSGLSLESNLPYDTFSSNLRHHSSAFNDLHSGDSISMFASSGEFNSALSSQISPN